MIAFNYLLIDSLNNNFETFIGGKSPQHSFSIAVSVIKKKK